MLPNALSDVFRSMGGGTTRQTGGTQQTGGQQGGVPPLSSFFAEQASMQQTPPFLAIGWTPKGEAYYGEGLKGWSRRVFGRLFDPANFFEGTGVEDRDAAMRVGRGFAQSFMGAMPEPVQDLDTFLQGFLGEDWLAGAATQTLLMRENPLGSIPKAFSGVLRGEFDIAMGIFQLGSEPFRRSFAAGAALEDIANIYDPANRMSDMYQTEEGEPSPLGDFLNAYKQNMLLRIGYNLVRINRTENRNYNTEQEIWDANLKASNMVYTSWFDEAVRHEALNRMRAGEPATFVTEDLANPWIELGGDVFFDLFNVFDLAFAAPAKLRRIASGADEFMKLADDALPIQRSLQAAFNASDDVAALPHLKSALSETLENLARKNVNLDAWADEYKLYNFATGRIGLTSEAKQMGVLRRVNPIVGLITKSLPPEDAVNVLADMFRIFNRDEGIATAALANLWRTPFGKTFFSPAGQTTLAMFGRMADEFGDIAKFAKSLAGKSADEIAESVLPRMTKVLDNVFPSVDEMEAAAKLVAKGGEGITPNITKLANRYDDIGDTTKFFNKFNRKLGKIYDPFNRYFAYTYMGLNPGYAMRNLFTDNMAILADQGPWVSLKNLGGQIADAVTGGRITTSRIDSIRKWMGGYVDEAAVAGKALHAAEAPVKRFGFLGVAETMESRASVVIFHNRVVKSMKQLLNGGAIPQEGLDNLRKLGLSQGMIDDFMQRVFANQGDVRKAATEFMAMAGTGFRETWRNVPLPRRLQGFLEGHNLEETVLGVQRHSGSDDEFRRGIEAIREDVARVGDSAPGQSRRIPQASLDAGPELAVIEDAIKRGVYPESEALFRARRLSLDEAVDTATEAMTESLRALKNKFPPGSIDETLFKWAAGEDAAKVAGEVATPTGRKAYERTNQIVRDFTDSIFARDVGAMDMGKGADQQKLRELWDTVKIGAANLGPSPEKLTYQTFRDALFDFWKSQTRQAYLESGRRYTLWMTDSVLMGALNDLGLPPDQVNALAAELMSSPKWNRALGKSRAMEAWYAAGSWDEAASKFGNLLSRMKGKTIADLHWPSLREVGWNRGPGSVENAVRLDRRAAGIAEDGEISLVEAIESINRRINPAVPIGDEMPTQHRAIYEQTAMFWDELTTWMDDVSANWGQTEKIMATPEMQKAFEAMVPIAERQVAEARLYANAVGTAERDLALHPYWDRTFADVAASRAMPYHYWYSRSYPKWIQRVVENPALIAAYAKYRRTLEDLNAGAPEWYKQNLVIDNILGLDLDDPLYFNLEASFNPLNGLTGVDFNDPAKRVTWYARMVDDAGKYGPSIFTPIQWLVAVGLYLDGEEDAAVRWMGRLAPITATTKSMLNKLGVNTGIPYNEIDPFVQLFSGGLDPYERKRVGRALGWMVDNTGLSAEAAQDAAHSQSGEVWEEAARIASDQRFAGQMSSFFLGAGFKARSETDMQVDKFYGQYFGLMDMRPNLTALEFRDGMAQLREQYPWMDTVLISRRQDDDRDTSYAYSVLARIPPGQISDFIGISGISNALIDQFYENKGMMTDWTPQDRDRFMAGIVDLGAILAIPDNATQLGWNRARNAYSGIRAAMAMSFGADIHERIDRYYQLDSEERSAFLEANPNVEQAFDFQSQLIISSPTVYQYYGGLNTLDRYYRGLMYDTLDAEFGDLTATWAEYDALKLTDERAAARYYKAHSELKRYRARRAEIEDQINRTIVDFSDNLPETPQVGTRPDFTPQSATQEDIQQGIVQQQAPLPTWSEISMGLSEPLQRMVIRYFMEGIPLTYAGEQQLGYAATRMGFEGGDELLRIIGISLQQMQQP